MRFSVASAKAEGVPEALAGRVKIEKCDFGGSFVMDIPPVTIFWEILDKSVIFCEY